MEAIVVSLISSYLSGGDSDSGGGGGGGSQVVKATPTDMSGFMKAFLDRFGQTEVYDTGTVKRLQPSSMMLLTNLGTLLNLRVRAPEYSKAMAIQASDEAIEGVVSKAVEASAKFHIPKIVNAMELGGSYSNTCTQALACDTLASDVGAIAGEAGMLRIQAIEAFAKIEGDRAYGLTQLLDVETRAYEIKDLKKDTQHSLNLKAAKDVAAIAAIKAIMDWGMDTLWKPFLPNGGDASTDSDTFGKLAGGLGVILPIVTSFFSNGSVSGDGPPTIPPVYQVEPVDHIEPAGLFGMPQVTFKTNTKFFREMMDRFEADIDTLGNPALSTLADQLRVEYDSDNSKVVQFLHMFRGLTTDTEQLDYIQQMLAILEA